MFVARVCRRRAQRAAAGWAGTSLILLAMMGVGSPARVFAEETAVEQIVGVLFEQGLIDEAQRTKILAKNAMAQPVASATPGVGASGSSDAPPFGLELSGDFRGRFESFYFDRDALGNERTNRGRFRYRLRIGAKKKLNDSVTLGFRIVSGDASARSTNQTFGSGPDFDTDPLMLDQAFVSFRLPDTGYGMKTSLDFGKVVNPFRWSGVPDLLIWDADLTLEGASVRSNWKLSETAWLFGNAGGYIVEERSTDADPKVFGLQFGGGTRLNETTELGLRVSGYEWRSLDDSFITRAKALGNLDGAFDGKARIAESSAYLRLDGSEAWPLLLHASVASNLTADSTTAPSGIRAGKENDAFAIGFEVGDPSKYFEFGASYFRYEANAVIAQFTESDPTDGLTNGEGFVLYVQRSLPGRANLKITLYDSDSLRSRGRATGPFAASLPNRDRKRLQTDISWKF